MNGESGKIKYSWQGHYMEDAFIAFVSFAATDGNFVELFHKETGNKFIPSTITIERLVDEACGRDTEFVQCFFTWCETKYGSVSEVFS